MKSFLVVLGFGIVFALFSFMQEPDLFVEFEQPEHVQPGTFYDLKIKIIKKDIEGFSKLDLNLPDGFSAQLVEGAGSKFYFSEQKIKLIWVALPVEDEFEVVIRISTDRELDGTYAFQGKVSYISGNGRKNKSLDTKIRVSNSITPPSQEVVITPQDNEETPDNSSSTTQVSEVSCERSLSTQNIQPGSSFTISLKINKGDFAGAGKVIESLPEGFSAEEIEANGAVFTATDNQVKFLWMTIPADQTFTVSYKVTVASTAEAGNNVVEGMFSYFDNGKTKPVIIPSSRIQVEGKTPVIAATNPTNTNSESTNTQTNNINPTQTNNTNTTQTTTAQKTEIASEAVEQPEGQTNISNSNADVRYRVQICATRKPASTDYFVKNNNVSEKIFVNMHEGWHKFTVGGFNVYQDARNHREQVKSQNKIAGPFVTAYNNGTRITVQEALMITNQKWVP
jgi:hypothetical protein